MKIICKKCGATYSITDEKLLGKATKLRCKKCQTLTVLNVSLGE